MERHLRHKFACEVFIGRNGFPPDINDFPNIDMIEAWRVLYLPKNVRELDYWYMRHLANRSFRWKQVECLPFHIPKDLSDDLKKVVNLVEQRRKEVERLNKLSLVTGQHFGY